MMGLFNNSGVLGYVLVYEKWAFYCYFEKLRGVSGRANC